MTQHDGGCPTCNELRSRIVDLEAELAKIKAAELAMVSREQYDDLVAAIVWWTQESTDEIVPHGDIWIIRGWIAGECVWDRKEFTTIRAALLAAYRAHLKRNESEVKE